MFSLLYHLHKILKLFLDLLFPIKCINCGRYGQHLCKDCFALVDIFTELSCPFCGASTDNSGRVCKKCRTYHFIDRIISAAPYQNFLIQKTIKAFKYSPFIKDLAPSLSLFIISHIFLTNNKTNFSEYYFIGVPSTKRKYKLRGFNHSELIAKEVAHKLGGRFLRNFLLKRKNTSSQTGLTRKERIQNVKGVFAIPPKNKMKVKNKKFIIVDDVCTTGATLDEIAKVLKENGAKEVIGMVVAKE